MKRTISLVFALLAIVFASFAQDQQQDATLKISGQLMSNQRILLKNGNWCWNENRLTLDFEKNITSNSKFYSEVWLRNIGLPQYYSLSDLYNKNITDPLNLELRQAYVTVYGLINGHMDLTVGKQIMSWGTADKFNPTNNLNPYDYEDVLDFGRKRGVLAAKADFYINSDNYIEAVFEPFFRPVGLPIGMFSNVLQSQGMQLPDNVTLNSMNDSLFLPSYSLKNSFSAGVRFKGFLAGFDYSLSYVYGFDYMPVPYQTNVYLSLASLNPPSFLADIQNNLDFYRRHIFGADFAGNIGGVGVWGEAALFMPTKDVQWTETTYYPVILGQQPQSTDSVLFAKNKPYVKYVLGADYTFANGLYVNTQFIHGFLHERWQGQLNDYLVFRAEKSFFNDHLKLAPLSGMVMVSDWSDVKNNYALAYFPQIIYKPVDNLEINLAAGIFDGKGQSMFANLKDYNMLIFGVKYDF